MPMHDWTRVEPNDYHTFHLSWIASLLTTLNNGRLPRDYFAMAEHTTPPIVPDLVTLALANRADDDELEPNGEGGTAVAAPPRASITVAGHARKRRPIGRRRVAIRHARDRRIVSVIEIVSPSNKAKKVEFDDLVGKSLQLLRQGVHLVLIDPFPPTRRDPRGLHAVVWRELTGQSVEPTTDRPLTLAAYVAQPSDEFVAYVEPLGVGDRLPDLPLFLTPDLHVPIPLEESYNAAWLGFPAALRAIVSK